MDRNKKYRAYLDMMSEALKKNDYDAFDVIKEMVESDVYEERDNAYLRNELNTTNFGILNHIFENELPRLFKSDKKAVAKITKTILEDKNLRSEFGIINTIRNYGQKEYSVMGPKETVEKILETADKNIDRKTLLKSNKKLMDVMIECKVQPTEYVNSKMKDLYEAVQYVLTNRDRFSVIMPVEEKKRLIEGFLEARKSIVVNESKNPIELLADFDKKVNGTLNESERELVDDIIKFKTPIAEKRREILFNKFKEDCIRRIDKMIAENEEDDGLKGLRERIMEKKYNKDTIVQDMAKLLEIRDVLMSE